MRGRAKQALADAERAREAARQSGAGWFSLRRLRRQADQVRRELDSPDDRQEASRLVRKMMLLSQTTKTTISAARVAGQRRQIRR